ncbi:hypothetical protein SAMN04515674_101525 [Pseudarcicella hirudinis]|uniref:Uncharacterized protein n=1 Tax=Pseudarcicella hirudinis TaxID=1079859 RepID=A0A1I5MZ76_9BACT|nr:hypothetical protein [Pseudarcicella hirudinis]SFP14925.1 hypothetical protein SAMN04515674_101525 [Pseudarcicella hirudinis]
MGAYKDATGKTRVGKVLQDIGGFFSGIFKKKTDTSSTSSSPAGTSSGSDNSKGATGTFDWASLIVTIGGIVGGVLGINSGENAGIPANTTITPAQQQQLEDEQSAKTGKFTIIGIVLVVVAIISFFIFRKKK